MILLDNFIVNLSFWNRVWSENGCPSSGVLSQIRKKAKSCYKYAVRSLKRQKDHIVSKISFALTGRHNRVFWQEVNCSKTAKCSQSSIDDGFTNIRDIKNNFSSKLSTVFNPVEEDLAFLFFLQDLSCTDNLSNDPMTVTEALEKLRSNSRMAANSLLMIFFW